MMPTGIVCTAHPAPTGPGPGAVSGSLGGHQSQGALSGSVSRRWPVPLTDGLALAFSPGFSSHSPPHWDLEMAVGGNPTARGLPHLPARPAEGAGLWLAGSALRRCGQTSQAGPTPPKHVLACLPGPSGTPLSTRHLKLKDFPPITAPGFSVLSGPRSCPWAQTTELTAHRPACWCRHGRVRLSEIKGT